MHAESLLTKHKALDALRIALTSPTVSAPETRARIGAVVARFAIAGAADGTIRLLDGLRPRP